MKSLPQKLAINASIGMAYVFLLYFLWQVHPDITGEDRLMENLQALSLFGSMALALVSLALFRRGFPPYVGGGLAVFFLSLLLRELDVEKLDLPAVVIALGSGPGKSLLLVLLWAAVLIAVVRNARRLMQDARDCLRSPLGYYLLGGAFFYLASEIFDKKMVPLAKPLSVFCEEMVECLATLCFVLGAAAWTAANRRRARSGAGKPVKGGASDDEIR